MKITKLDSQETQFRKMLYNLQSYMDKPRSSKNINPRSLACDLYEIGEKSKTPERESVLTNCLTSLAENMVKLKRDNLAGVVYSFLIKFNKDNPIQLKQILPKALECAKMHNDSVHVAARCEDLIKMYKYYEIHGTNYLSCLNLRKKSLEEVCNDYDSVKKKYRTISRKLNSRDKYVDLLIRTKVDIANELGFLNQKSDARKELLSAYKDFDKFSDGYKAQNEKNYSGLKKYLSITITDDTLCKGQSFNNDYEKFMKVSKNIIQSVREKAPIENAMFSDFYSEMFDKFKSNSLDSLFIKKSFELVKKLNSLGNSFISSRIIKILLEKNETNIKNLKDIELEILKIKDSENDYFGLIHHSVRIQKLFKKDPKSVSISSHLVASQFHIKALNHIISDYENLSLNRTLKPKEEYIEELIFAKVNSARLQRNTYPEYFKSALHDADKLIESLPAGYITNHPEMKKVVRFVTQQVDEL